MKRLATCGLVVILLATCLAPASASIVVGNDLINRSVTDLAVGGIFVLANQPSEAVGGHVVAWSFFDDKNATETVDTTGRFITPLLLTKSGTTFTIAGIGTSRTTDQSGIQSFAFDLVSGTSLIGSNTYLGWFDGSPTAANMGVIEFDSGGSDDYTGIVYRSNSSPALVTVGKSFTSFTGYARTYSVQYTAAPEPAAVVVWSLFGLLGLAAVAWRKRAARG